MKHLKSLWSISLVLAALAGPGLARAQDAQGTTDPAASTGDAAASGEATPASDATASDEAAPADGEAAPTATTTSAQAAPSDQTQSDGAASLATPTGEGEGEGEGDQAAPTQDEASAAEAQAAAEPLAWRNSFFSYSLGVTFNSFCRGCQLSYNPLVYQYFFLQPRWYLDPQTFFVISAGAYYEFTNDDSSAYNHEFQLGDLSVELRRSVAWEGFVFLPSVRLGFPLSKGSQAAQRYVNTGVGVTIVRPIPEALGMTIAAGVSYRRWWAGSNVVLARTGQCLSGQGPTEGSPCDGASATEADRVSTSLTINVTPVEHLTVTLQGAWIFINGHGLADAVVDPLSGQLVIPDGSPSHWRAFTYYTLALAYDFVEWLNVSVSIANSSFIEPFFNDDGSVRSPFNPNTQLGLSATFTLDTLYEFLSGGGEEPDDGLTPEERQRRRQGLASRDGDDEDEESTSRSGSSARSTF